MRIDGWQGELGGPRWWARLLSFSAVVGLLLGILGPFGSYLNGSPVVLALHWTVMTMLGAVFAGLIVPRLVRSGQRLGLPLLFSLALAIALLAVPLSALSSVEAGWLWPRQTSHLGPADWYSQTLLCCAFTTALWLLVEFARGAFRHGASPLTPSIAGASALCLQMEDHYVRVHRESGSTLELMTLQEAIDRYGGGDGLQVHRSWWVADDAVDVAEQDGRNWRLRLVNGLTVPVARNRVAEARAHGWITAE